MRIIKLINAKPSLLQGEVNHYLKKVQNKYPDKIKIKDIKTCMVADGVEQACIIITVHPSLDPDIALSI